MKHYSLLDPLRLILAILVVSGHYFGWQVFPAVPGFLALSGFLVLQSFDKDPRWQFFTWKRMVRVYPALLGLFAMAVVLAPSHVIGMGCYYLRFGFAPKSWDDSLWSLPFEEVLYFILVILYLGGSYRRRWPIWTGAIIGFTLCVYGILFASGETIPRTLPLVWCFFIGNLMYIYRDQLRKYRLVGLPMIALAIIAQTYGILTKQMPHTISLAALPAAPGILLIGTQFSPELQRLPDLSNSCYIWHYLLLQWCLSAGLTRWSALCVLPLACLASWYLIEKPMKRYKSLSIFTRAPIPATA